MLDDENDIEQQADIRQSELDRVADQSRPIRLQRAVDHQLQQAQNPARGVQENLVDRPAGGRLSPEIRRDLRDVFAEREDQLDVSQGVNLCDGSA